MESSDSRLRQIWERVGKLGRVLATPEIATLAQSSNADDRLLALVHMRKAIESGTSAATYLPLARKLVDDPDNTCRWQALIVIGELVATDPDAVWSVVSQYGSSPDPDMRTGIATILLEHLLERHLKRFWPKVRERALNPDPLFADTLATCWVDEPDSPVRQRIQHLLTIADAGGLQLE